ncbi:MAG: histidine triad nucleotide-binding protein [Pseudomonadota bacterium]
MTDCLFCKIIEGAIPSNKVFEDDTSYAFEDLHPGAPTHVLVVPKKHIARVADMAADDEARIGHLFSVANQVAAARGLEHYRLVINNGEGVGQSVFHVHLHVLGGRTMQWPPG